MPKDFSPGRSQKSRKHSQYRRFAGTRGTEKGENCIRLDREVHRRDDLNFSAFRLLKTLFDLTRLDDGQGLHMRERGGWFFLHFQRLRYGGRRLEVSIFQRSHNGLPCFLRESIQELVAFAGLPGADDRY